MKSSFAALIEHVNHVSGRSRVVKFLQCLFSLNKAGTLVHLLICRAGRIKSGLVEFSRFNHHFCHELIQKVCSRKNTDRFVPFKVSWSFILRTDSRPGVGTKNKIGIHFIHQRIAEIQKFTVTKKIEGIDPSKRVRKRF